MGYINLYGISIYGGFHSHGDSPFMDGFFENPIEMDDLGGTPISGNLSIYIYIYINGIFSWDMTIKYYKSIDIQLHSWKMIPWDIYI